jgi:hypothetical protein
LKNQPLSSARHINSHLYLPVQGFIPVSSAAVPADLLEFFRERYCEQGQGFLFSSPMTAEEATNFHSRILTTPRGELKIVGK